MQITSLDYSSFVGRIAIGRVARGTIKENQPVSLVKRDGKIQKSRIKELYTFEGLGKVKTQAVNSGDICAIALFYMGRVVYKSFNAKKGCGSSCKCGVDFSDVNIPDQRS